MRTPRGGLDRALIQAHVPVDGPGRGYWRGAAFNRLSEYPSRKVEGSAAEALQPRRCQALGTVPAGLAPGMVNLAGEVSARRNS